MKLYLVRHGEAVPERVNPQRPLSERGRAEVERVASFLGKAGIEVAAVLHSGKSRAKQTADVLAASVVGGARPKRVSGIDPLDGTEAFARTLATSGADGGCGEDLMVVGHLPFLGKLVSRLIVGDEAASIVTFPTSTVVCLERSHEGGWSIAWMLRPSLLAGADNGQP